MLESPPHHVAPMSRSRLVRTLTCAALVALIGLAMPGGIRADSPRALAEASSESAGDVARVVSLNPSLTAIALALGGGDRLVGVDDYSARLEADVVDLPRVGGLFSPNLEAVLALAPDVVVLVPSVAQRDFRSRLEGLGVRVEVFENTRFDDVLENIERLGELLGQEPAARRRLAAIDAARARAIEVGRDRDTLKALIVIQREPLYVVGRGSFMAEMLVMLGAVNLGDTFDEAYPRAAEEWLVDSAPEVLIDIADDPGSAGRHWARHASLPAVREERVRTVAPDAVSMPGPYLDRSLAALADALYGEGTSREILDAPASPETDPPQPVTPADDAS